MSQNFVKDHEGDKGHRVEIQRGHDGIDTHVLGGVKVGIGIVGHGLCEIVPEGIGVGVVVRL